MKGAKFGREEQNLPSPQQMDRGLGTDTPIPLNPKDAMDHHKSILHCYMLCCEGGWWCLLPLPPWARTRSRCLTDLPLGGYTDYWSRQISPPAPIILLPVSVSPGSANKCYN